MTGPFGRKHPEQQSRHTGTTLVCSQANRPHISASPMSLVANCFFTAQTSGSQAQRCCCLRRSCCSPHGADHSSDMQCIWPPGFGPQLFPRLATGCISHWFSPGLPQGVNHTSTQANSDKGPPRRQAFQRTLGISAHGQRFSAQQGFPRTLGAEQADQHQGGSFARVSSNDRACLDFWPRGPTSILTRSVALNLHIPVLDLRALHTLQQLLAAFANLSGLDLRVVCLVPCTNYIKPMVLPQSLCKAATWPTSPCTGSMHRLIT